MREPLMGRLQLRAWEGDLLRWQETSARHGYRSVSEWIRHTLNRQTDHEEQSGEVVYGRTTLDNGVRVVTESVPATRAVSLAVLLAGGAHNELPGEEGLAHRCTRMMLEGTARRTGGEIVRDLEALGGEAGVLLHRDYTGLVLSVMDDNAYPALDLLGGLLIEPAFPPEAWVKLAGERPRPPGRLLREQVRAAAWPAQAMGRDLWAADPAMPRAAALTFWRRAVQAGQVIVAAVGGIRHREFAAQANDVFWRLPNGTGAPVPPTPRLAAAFVHEIREDVGRSYFCCGIPAPGYTQPERLGWQVWAQVLGGGLSSRLHRRLCEQEPLVYGVRSEYECAGQGGMLWIEGSTVPANVFAAVQEVLAELFRLGTGQAPVNEEELAWAKTKVRTELLRGAADLRAQSTRLAADEMYLGRRIATADRLEEVNVLRQDALAGLRFTLLDRLANVDVGVIDPALPAGPAARDRAALSRFLGSFRGRCRRARRRR